MTAFRLLLAVVLVFLGTVSAAWADTPPPADPAYLKEHYTKYEYRIPMRDGTKLFTVVVMRKGLIQQLGTPTEIYDRPANTFVASFIGNPAMNLMQGHLKGGRFEGDHVSIGGLKGPDGPVTLGFRAEDASVAAAGEITAPVYTMELLGDATMVTVRAGGALVAVKAGKDYRAEIGDAVSIRIPAAACHLFHAETGERLTG